MHALGQIARHVLLKVDVHGATKQNDALMHLH